MPVELAASPHSPSGRHGPPSSAPTSGSGCGSGSPLVAFVTGPTSTHAPKIAAEPSEGSAKASSTSEDAAASTPLVPGTSCVEPAGIATGSVMLAMQPDRSCAVIHRFATSDRVFGSYLISRRLQRGSAAADSGPANVHHATAAFCVAIHWLSGPWIGLPL